MTPSGQRAGYIGGLDARRTPLVKGRIAEASSMISRR